VVTVRVRVVVLFKGVPVTVIVELPTGVVALVAIVSVLVQVGLHGLVVKLAVAPAGKPEAASVTPWVAPLTRVLVIVLVPDAPWTTGMWLELARL
jgi:hypothetical protein